VSSPVFACLVHEKLDVVADLLANLAAFEADARILLYDGGPDGRLRVDLSSTDSGLLLHPTPKPMRWGRLHDFAIDSMRFALEELDFDSLTIVDSDQLLIKPGYTERVGAFLAEHPTVGMLGNAPGPQPRTSRIDPVRVALREPELWRRFLDRLPGGSRTFPHWTFWPSTVFTRRAAADLVRLFEDRDLQAIMRRTRMFATEEIVLPTLVAALGYEIAEHPASYDFVRYRVAYGVADVDRAIANPDAFWMHPVPRQIDDPVRTRIREVAARRRPMRPPASASAPKPPDPAPDAISVDDRGGLIGLTVSLEAALTRLRPGRSVSLTAESVPVTKVLAVARALAAGHGASLRHSGRAVEIRAADGATGTEPATRLVDLAAATSRMVGIEGWFEPDEAILLAATAAAAIHAGGPSNIAEVGSHCGRATTVLGSVARHSAGVTVFAVDRFDGVVGEAGRLFRCGPTLGRFRRAIADAGLDATVREVVGDPSHVAWTKPVALLLVDGLHDHSSVAADFRHFEPWLEPTGFVAFHDYTTFAGVRRFVDELLRSGDYVETARLGSLIVVRPRSAATSVLVPGLAAPARPPAAPQPWPIPVAAATAATAAALPAAPGRPQPLVSCLMPTFNRRAHVPAAIERFLAQDYPSKELLVVDDGTDPVGDLVPDDPRIRYLSIPARMTIGAKRNLAAELASGEILANWDDDDWVASWRLSYEVDALLRSDADVVGLSTLLYLEPASGKAWRYAYPRQGAPWVHDPTFCVRRATWEAERFPDSNYGLDTAYLTRGRRKRVAALPNERFYVGMIHAGNTSRKDTRGGRWRPTSAEELLAMMAADGTDTRARGFPN